MPKNSKPKANKGDEILKRMLQTPHKPHAPTEKKVAKKVKPDIAKGKPKKA